jgi:Domain of unknown function (DUF4124)
MRKLGVVALVVAGSGLAWGMDIYVWRDRGGQQHFSNVPVPGAEVRSVEDAETAVVAGEATAQGGRAATEEEAAFSTSASLHRQALERDLRDTQRQLQELDGRLSALERVRLRNAAGSDATGGVGTAAGGYRTEEEKTLAVTREQLAKHAAQVRDDYAKLRDDVTSRLGTTPAWWIEAR